MESRNAQRVRLKAERDKLGATDPEGLAAAWAMVEDLWSSAVARAVAQARTRGTRRPDGRTRVEMPIESIEHACTQLMRVSPQVEVVRPVALRRALVARLKASLQLHGG